MRESIRIILLTEPGERLMREGFGCGLRRFLFEPNTATTRAADPRARSSQAIGRWEPRVRSKTSRSSRADTTQRLVAITILFRLVATQAQGRIGSA